MSLITNLMHWFPLKVDGADSIGGATPSVSNVTFSGAHASFTASASSYIHWGNVFNVGTSNLTMAGWVYVTFYAGSGHQGAVFSKACSSLNAQTGNAIYFYNSQSIAQVGSGGTSTSATTTLPPAGAWHHIVLTRDGTTIKQYVDGILVDTQTSAGVYDITSGASNTFLTVGAIRIPGSSFWYGGLDGNVNDLLAYDRALSAAEIFQICAAGPGNFSTLLDPQYLTTEIGTIVHSAEPYSTLDILESTVVHGSVKHATTDTLIATTVHAGVVVSGTVANITGTVSSSATWDATTLGFSTGSTSFQWEWQSVPVGSSLTSGSFQLPNTGSTSLLNMSGNTGLWHLESTSSTSTQIGSVGLVDTYGDGWHGANWVSVLVNSIVVIDSATLAAGAGPEWYDYTAVDGDSVEVIFSTLGCAGPHYGSECSFVLNSGSNGSGTTFSSSATCPIGTHSYTANGFSTSSIITTLDYSGNDNTATVYGTTQTTNTRVGDYAFNFNGSSDYVELVKPDVLGIDGSKSRTIAFWASASAWADSTIMFSMGTNSTDQDFTFIQKATNNLGLAFWAGGSDLIVPAASTTGWNHYCIIYDSASSTSYIYQNNELLGSTVRAQNTSNSSNIKIGEGTAGWAAGAAPHFSGSISEFAIWNRVLSDTDRENIFFLQSGSCASGNFSGSVGLGDGFTFMPEVSGTYEIKLNVTDGTYNDSGSIYAYITSEPSPPGPTPGPITSGSNPTVNLVESKNLGYIFNTYRIQNLSVQRSRTSEQVPFKLGTKGKQSLRNRTNSEFTGSS